MTPLDISALGGVLSGQPYPVMYAVKIFSFEELVGGLEGVFGVVVGVGGVVGAAQFGVVTDTMFENAALEAKFAFT